MAHKIYQIKFKIFPNTKYAHKKLPKTCKIFAKVAQFHQIWSHCKGRVDKVPANLSAR